MSENEVPHHLGAARINPPDPVIAGSVGTWTITYTAGAEGIRPGGGLKITKDFGHDWAAPQLARPEALNYVSAEADDDVPLRVSFDPWRSHHELAVQVLDRALPAGGCIRIIYGDRRGGSPGFQSQTWDQRGFTFHVAVDTRGDGAFGRLPEPPRLDLVPGPGERVRVSAPSVAVAGRPFTVHVRVEDHWGNAANFQGALALEADCDHAAMPEPHVFTAADEGAHRFTEVVLSEPGTYRLRARSADDGLTCESNPIVCQAEAPAYELYWGDLHAQTQRRWGEGLIDAQFAFARESAGLDFSSVQANDHIVPAAAWEEMKAAANRFHEDGRFVGVVGYEWSDISPRGGDHNVYYRGAEGPIHRCGHSGTDGSLEDTSDAHLDRTPITALYETLRERDDVLVVPHMGGRPANLEFHDPELERVMEVYSTHGYFPWFVEEALRRGYRLGIIAGSDDHKGRPGASHCGRSVWRNHRGGLTAVYARDLSREALFEALRARRCYGTSGARILVRFGCTPQPPQAGAKGEQPQAGERMALMGEEFETGRPPKLQVWVQGTAPIERVVLRRGLEVIHEYPAPGALKRKADLLRLSWGGGTTSGTGPDVRMAWHGELLLDRGRFAEVREWNTDTPDEGITAREERRVAWRSFTGGGREGILFRAEAPREAWLSFRSHHANFDFTLGEALEAGKRLALGPYRRAVTVERAPARDNPEVAAFTFTDEDVRPGCNPYWITVEQIDGEMAWAGPIFVDYKG